MGEGAPCGAISGRRVGRASVLAAGRGEGVAVDDFKLTDHFSFFEVTGTSNAALQAKNRAEAEDVIPALKALAIMLEQVRAHTGPLRITSGYRCAALNGATVGSSKKSQHMKGEAADFVPVSGEITEETLEMFFQQVLVGIIAKGIPFGQIIKEQAKRDYSVSRWLHLSLGAPFREAAVCGQVLTMTDGKYILIKQVPIGR